MANKFPDLEDLTGEALHPCYLYRECRAAGLWGGYPEGLKNRTGACEQHAPTLRSEAWGSPQDLGQLPYWETHSDPEGDPDRIHATFTFRRHYPTLEEMMGIMNIISLSELLERSGIKYVGRPLDEGNITDIFYEGDYVEICVSWEVEEVIGE